MAHHDRRGYSDDHDTSYVPQQRSAHRKTATHVRSHLLGTSPRARTRSYGSRSSPRITGVYVGFTGMCVRCVSPHRHRGANTQVSAPSPARHVLWLPTRLEPAPRLSL